MKLTKEDFSPLGLYEEILNRSDEGVNVVNLEGVIIFANRLSAEYCGSTVKEMLGKHITDFYPDAMLLSVLKNKNERLNEKIHFIGRKRYMCSSFPIYNGNELIGAYSIFRDVLEIDELNKKVKYLELQINLNKPEENLSDVVDSGGTMQLVFNKAKKTVGSLGGPRHSIITGESGTGKTMLANLIYHYAKKIGVIGKDAPFIEINCAQFTNADIAAMEIFGSVEGAYTGSKGKKGLFEQANGGILFLDEAHTLESYQSMLLKAIESGKIRRIGDTKEIGINVIIIAASTRNLHEVLLPELYQRLAQYEMYLPSLKERSIIEKEQLLEHFIKKYEGAVKESHGIQYHVQFTQSAKEALLHAVYPRNIRQFRDIINFSIDSSAPLIEDVRNKKEITTIVDIENIPFEIMDLNQREERNSKKITEGLSALILDLHQKGMGARKIASQLKKSGYEIEYYQIAYYLKNNRQ